MAQVSWLYLNDAGGRHRVGLYHGDQSGHLVIYCNLKIVQIDFNVLDSKTYTFFIENDLIEVRLWRENDGKFSYEFFENKQADTPKNQERKIEMKQNSWKIALFFGLGLAVVIGGFFGFRAWNRKLRQAEFEKFQSERLDGKLTSEAQQKLLANGKTAPARVYFLKDEGRRRAMYAFQTADNQRFQGKIIVADTGQIMLPTGFELADRDEFEVIYLPENPETHIVRYDLPTALQRQLYFRAAVGTEQLAHPEDGAARSTCIVFTVEKERGWQCLADFIFQKTPPEKNVKNNSDSYLRLIREVSISKKIKDVCWDK